MYCRYNDVGADQCMKQEVKDEHRRYIIICSIQAYMVRTSHSNLCTVNTRALLSVFMSADRQMRCTSSLLGRPWNRSRNESQRFVVRILPFLYDAMMYITDPYWHAVSQLQQVLWSACLFVGLSVCFYIRLYSPWKGIELKRQEKKRKINYKKRK